MKKQLLKIASALLSCALLFTLASCGVEVAQGNPQDEISQTTLMVTTLPPTQKAYVLPQKVATLLEMSFESFSTQFPNAEVAGSEGDLRWYNVSEGEYKGFSLAFEKQGDGYLPSSDLINRAKAPMSEILGVAEVTLDDIADLMGSDMLLTSSDDGLYAATWAKSGILLRLGKFDLDKPEATSSEVTLEFYGNDGDWAPVALYDTTKK